MKLYSENKNYKLYQGNMLDMLEVIEPNTIDSIVTDPPYGLTSITKIFGKENSTECQYGKDGSFQRLSKGFMGKEWDGSGIEYNIETWKKCYEVLKPGGYLLAFGGSRTFHRIACAIEDAGFEIRDTIMWLYGCLSNDTEILTSDGWKNSETIKINDEIYSLDLEKDIIIKNKCLNVFKYNYEGEMVNLKNDNTNQLLTPNHHCIVRDKIKTQIKGKIQYNTHDYWNYKDAWQIRSQTVKLPLAGNYDGKLEIGNLFAELLGWIISEGTYLKDTNAIMITQSSINQKYVERIRYILGKLHIKYNEYSRERIYKNKIYIEYDFYIGKQAEKTVDKIKELIPNKKLNWDLLELSLSNKEFLIKGLLQGDGAKCDNTLGFSAFYQKDMEQLQVFQALLHLTGKQGWINKKKYSCSIHNNPITELQGKHFKDRFVKYNGKFVWCIETEKGNFIAKRDGKIFITGNSGFPKSMNIGLAIDKKNGIDNRTGNIVKGMGSNNTNSMKNGLGESQEFASEYEERKATNEWQNWGTALKPSFEPIIVARKPFKGSLVDNVIEYGVGGINIDECRVGNEERTIPINAEEIEIKQNGSHLDTLHKNQQHERVSTTQGRFPANTILTYDETDFDEVCGGFPYTKNSKRSPKNNKDTEYTNTYTPPKAIYTENNTYGDSGSASRYFYCAKASKKDRDEGLEDFDEKNTMCDRNPELASANMPQNRSGNLRKNTHPTVKPTELMQYLVRLVTPNDGTILDPFNGSGSTGKAVMYENKERNKNYKYIGIELTEEYLPISKARIEYVCGKEQEPKQESLDLSCLD